MATFTRLRSGSWRAQVRRKGRDVSETFLRREDARKWATDTERQVDRGETPTRSKIARLRTFSDLVDLHIADMSEVGRAPGRTIDATLKMLTRELGKLSMAERDRERLLNFGRRRSTDGAGPLTLSMDIGVIKLVVQHAAAVHGLAVTVEPIDLARVALKRLGLVGNSNEREVAEQDTHGRIRLGAEQFEQSRHGVAHGVGVQRDVPRASDQHRPVAMAGEIFRLDQPRHHARREQFAVPDTVVLVGDFSIEIICANSSQAKGHVERADKLGRFPGLVQGFKGSSPGTAILK
jgi:hypothetical protein